jgi:hypothetical protein
MRRVRLLLAIVVPAAVLAFGSPARAEYHPTLGRWMQRDPLGYVDGANLYEYGTSSPTDKLDPMGWMVFALPPEIFIEGYPIDPFIPGDALVLPRPVPVPVPVPRPVPVPWWRAVPIPRWVEKAGPILEHADPTPLAIPRTASPDTPLDDTWSASDRSEEDSQGSEHTKGARKSTKDPHERGRARAKRDKPGGERGDARRTRNKETVPVDPDSRGRYDLRGNRHENPTTEKRKEEEAPFDVDAAGEEIMEPEGPAQPHAEPDASWDPSIA